MAIGIAAGIGAIGSIAGGAIGSKGAQSAAKTQAAAAQQAAQAALQQQQITRGDLAPFRTAGTDALASLRSALGLPPSQIPTGAPAPGTMDLVAPDGSVYSTVSKEMAASLKPSDLTPGYHFVPTPPPTALGNAPNPLTANGLSGLTFQPTQAQLEAMPGYQFDLAQGQRGVENSAAAQGRGISGAALKGAANFATGLANNTLTTEQQIFQQNLANVMNPLQALAGLGENAAATTGNLGQGAVNSANAANIGGANALAAGTVGSANAIGGALGGLGGSASNFLLFNALTGGSGGGSGFGNAIANSGSGGFQALPNGSSFPVQINSLGQ
jgi:hypothetical protein